MKHACTDCVEVHGDDAAEWLRKWPTGCEWREELHAWLCDGCADERYDDLAQRDPCQGVDYTLACHDLMGHEDY